MRIIESHQAACWMNVKKGAEDGSMQVCFDGYDKGETNAEGGERP